MRHSQKTERSDERGIALVAALLATMLILALGMAVVFSTTTDTTTTRAQRLSEQAFFAADAGIGVARKSVVQAFQAALTARLASVSPYAVPPTPNTSNPDWFPNVQVLPDPASGDAFYTNLISNAVTLATASARATRYAAINDTKFNVTVHPFTGTITRAFSGPLATGTEVVVLRYWVEVTGTTGAGGTATVNETGRINANINMLYSPPSGTNRNFSFSGFGAFFDNGDTNASSYLAGGTFSGPVHTNSHFAFSSGRSVTFRNITSQVDSQIRYDSPGSTTPNHTLPKASPVTTGITVSSEGYVQAPYVPLPSNVFSQEYSVINATGITDLKSDGTPKDPPTGIPVDGSGNPLPILDSSGQVTKEALIANLRDGTNAKPTASGSTISNGVWVSSSDGNNITGAGIYVQGGASDVQLIAQTNGDQVFKITNATTGVLTTITEHFDAAAPANETTTVTTGSTTRTFTGVFKDRSGGTVVKNGAMLFVGNTSGTGSINSLRGGKDSSNNLKGISSSTALTITAQRNIQVTGDLKYADPVVASDGTPVSNVNSINNVLGIFTNNGNVLLAPNSNYVGGGGLSLEINAAVVSFNSKTSDDSGAVGGIDGSITYNGSTGTSSSDRWRLVGSRVQAKINNIGFTNRDLYYDTRFSGGHFRPPFFPGTSYSLGPPPSAGELSFAPPDAPAATAMSWFRNNN